MTNFTLNEKDVIINLIVGLIKRHCIKMSQYLPKHSEVWEEILMLKLISQIMQQKLI